MYLLDTLQVGAGDLGGVDLWSQYDPLVLLAHEPVHQNETLIFYSNQPRKTDLSMSAATAWLMGVSSNTLAVCLARDMEASWINLKLVL